MNQNTSTFQSAIAIVEALPVEEQTMLLEVINNRLKEQRRTQLIEEVKLRQLRLLIGRLMYFDS